MEIYSECVEDLHDMSDGNIHHCICIDFTVDHDDWEENSKRKDLFTIKNFLKGVNVRALA